MFATCLRHLAGALALTLAAASHAAPPPASVQLYALDCGHIAMKDFGPYADTGEYDGKPMTLATPCFLIRHPKGTLVWDTGLGDAIAARPGGEVDYGSERHVVPVTLVQQLAQLSLAPADVNFVAFSHFHFDHMGNAALFGKATWLLNADELAWGERDPRPTGDEPSTPEGYKTAQVQRIRGDHDVFGDGSVRILKAPGHTPGHQVLMLKLAKAGTVILSGDLWHARESLVHHRVPTFNVSRADTLASMDRIETIAKRKKARIVIQHDAGDFKALPKFPAYLD